MGQDEPESPEPYFGDYPHGAYWSAIRPEGAEERVVDDAEHYSYKGTGLASCGMKMRDRFGAMRDSWAKTRNG